VFFSSFPLLEAFGVTFVFGLAAWLLGTVSLSGLAGGVLVGGFIYYLAGWRAFAVLGFFFVIGSALTKLGYRRKKALGAAQEKEGRRGARHALANCAVGLALAAVYKLSGAHPLAGTAFVASFATAAADTAGTEAGSLYGKTHLLPTNLKRVPPGTDGAVSIEGTLASLLAACVVSSFGSLVGLVPSGGLWLAAFLGGFLGAGAESVLGSLPRVEKTLGNEGMNLLNTFLGVLFCLIIAGLTGWS